MSARVDRRRDANWAAAVYWPHLVRPIAIVLVRELDRLLRGPTQATDPKTKRHRQLTTDN